MKRVSAARRHLAITAILAAAIVAPIARLSNAQFAIKVPWLKSEEVNRLANVEREWQAISSPAPADNGQIQHWLMWAWLIGAAVTVGRFGRQSIAVRGIRRRAIAAHESDFASAIACAIAAARHAARFHNSLDIRISNETDVPFVHGLVHPVLVLPSEASEWGDEVRHHVLTHELAHLARHDLWSQKIAALACVLHWFNPIVWLLARAASEQAEFAADDVALSGGILPSGYADTLLSFVDAQSFRNVPVAAVTFRTSQSLAPRIHALLEAHRSRRAVSGKALGSFVSLGALVAVAVSCVHLEPGASVASALKQPSLSQQISSAPAARSTEVQTDTSKSEIGNDDWVVAAVEGLVRLLDDPSPQVRATALSSLRRFNRGDERSVVNTALTNAHVSPDVLFRTRDKSQ